MNHKFALGQVVTTDNDTFCGAVEIVKHIDARCAAHSLPMYACVAGDRHFSFCEEAITPLTTNMKRKLN